MDNAPEPFDMINLDRLATRDLEAMSIERKRCDYLYLGTAGNGGHVVIAPIELKGGTNFRSATVVKQLQAGAKIADAIVPADV